MSFEMTTEIRNAPGGGFVAVAICPCGEEFTEPVEPVANIGVLPLHPGVITIDAATSARAIEAMQARTDRLAVAVATCRHSIGRDA